jgi:hypothetical protein
VIWQSVSVGIGNMTEHGSIQKRSKIFTTFKKYEVNNKNKSQVIKNTSKKFDTKEIRELAKSNTSNEKTLYTFYDFQEIRGLKQKKIKSY